LVGIALEPVSGFILLESMIEAVFLDEPGALA
jgi:hypothetical protein